MSEPVLVAKMFLQSKTEGTDPSGAKTQESYTLSAVSTGDGEVNKQWSKWTPYGKLELCVTNPDAFDRVASGYYKVLIVPCGKND